MKAIGRENAMSVIEKEVIRAMNVIEKEVIRAMNVIEKEVIRPREYGEDVVMENLKRDAGKIIKRYYRK